MTEAERSPWLTSRCENISCFGKIDHDNTYQMFFFMYISKPPHTQTGSVCSTVYHPFMWTVLACLKVCQGVVFSKPCWHLTNTTHTTPHTCSVRMCLSLYLQNLCNCNENKPNYSGIFQSTLTLESIEYFRSEDFAVVVVVVMRYVSCIIHSTYIYFRLFWLIA